MKAKSKKLEPKKSGYDKRIMYTAVAIAAVLILASVFLFFVYPRSPVQPKAAIIDQLGSSKLGIARYPNSTFIETAKELLYERFSEVDYYSDNATVDSYKRLASLGYKLIIWRAHSALSSQSYVAITTVEKYGTKDYSQYLDNGQLTVCNITGELYIGITPKFVSDFMSGKFEDTVVIFMSCNGLKVGYFKTAEAFMNKGVKAFISWNGWISPSDNDNAMTSFLQYLINENNTISEAVSKIPDVFSEWGPSGLDYYPHEDGNYRIPDYRQNNVASNAAFMLMQLKNLQLRRAKLAR